VSASPRGAGARRDAAARQEPGEHGGDARVRGLGEHFLAEVARAPALDRVKRAITSAERVSAGHSTV
jgi:hypothetical protein